MRNFGGTLHKFVPFQDCSPALCILLLFYWFYSIRSIPFVEWNCDGDLVNLYLEMYRLFDGKFSFPGFTLNNAIFGNGYGSQGNKESGEHQHNNS